MIDPVEAQQIALAAILAGAIVFFGAGYAVFYAFAMLKGRRVFRELAYGSYICLFCATVAMAVIMQLTGWWAIVVISVLAGYFVAPRFIWRLSVAVHEVKDELEDTGEAAERHPAEVTG